MQIRIHNNACQLYLRSYSSCQAWASKSSESTWPSTIRQLISLLAALVAFLRRVIGAPTRELVHRTMMLGLLGVAVLVALALALAMAAVLVFVVRVPIPALPELPDLTGLPGLSALG